MNGILPELFGGGHGPPLMPLPTVPVYVMEWPWLRPLSAILAFARWTIDDVVSSPRAAWEVRVLWKAYKLAQKVAADRDAKLERADIFWFRRQGCPVPCPDCGIVEPCRCIP